MNEIVNKFLLAGDKYMPKMHLKIKIKIKNEFQNLKKQEIQAVFTKINLIRLVLNMIWHMGILKI